LPIERPYASPVAAHPPGAPIGDGASVLPDGTAVVGEQRFEVRVTGDCERVQRYVAGAPVVETVFVTADGATGVTDLLWQGSLLRVVTPYSGAAAIEVEGPVGADGGHRLDVLRGWWSEAPDGDGPDRELHALSVALTAACRAEPGALRPCGEVDDLGLWRLPDGTADLGSHAAFAAAAT
jgi:hypothetical protein